ncbi:tyrosine-type recombinase/integrase [Aliikangiella maris]|uniref:Tyrosine-type recombinase/integrase n=2 Tax=Aliikangiella maris TaxID=3162458 RepID=A0ABV2BYF3_9GAMM
MTKELEFKWVWKAPNLRKVKQADTLSPEEFLDLVIRIDNERVDPLIALRNQCMLLMTYFSCFRAIEVSQWKVKEALSPVGNICQMTKLRKDATKGNYPAIAPVVIKEQRDFLNKWFAARVKYKIGMSDNSNDEYRGLDPESHVFLSKHHGRWRNFSLTRKITKDKEYHVATAVQNLLTKIYKGYGFPKASSHSARHSMGRFAQELYEKKSDPDARRIIQNLLHHRTEESQKHYTEINFEHIRECAKKIMPKPKKRGRPKKTVN